jgi:hypothetical protein
MEFFRKYGGYLFLLLALTFSAWAIFARPAINFLEVVQQSRGSSVKIDQLFLSSGGYVVVSRVDRIGEILGGTEINSEYLLPGNYYNLYAKVDELSAVGEVVAEQGVLVEIYRETHRSSTNELFYGPEDVIAKDIFGRPLRKMILFN